MNEKKQFRAIKGTRDILPPDSALWNWFEATARRVMETYGFREIRLPIFEETELFARSIGVDTDVVSKEMYTFRDRSTDLVVTTGVGKAFVEFKSRLDAGDPSARRDFERVAEAFNKYLAEMTDAEPLTLRPEATASVVRAYIEHGMHTLPGNVKLYYVGPMFRRERPQKGRYRQFYQIGAEVLGQSDAPAIDAELLEMMTVLLRECGIGKWTLLINSIGCKDCRPRYVETLRAALNAMDTTAMNPVPLKMRMCADCQRRADTNPLRVLDCKVPQDQPIIEKLPSIADHLDEPCRAHFDELQRQLKLREIAYTITPRLVRGLDYYVRTTFEITSPVLGAQNALLGGGRYDGLAEILGGDPTKGVGFALGQDRFIDALKETHKGKDLVEQFQMVFDAVVIGTDGPTWDEAVAVAASLRRKGLRVYLPEPGTKMRKALDLANRLRIRVAVIVGESERKAGQYVIRTMLPFGEQEPRDGAVLTDALATYGRLVKLRIDLERAMRELARPHGFFHSSSTITSMSSYLKSRNLLPDKIAHELDNLVPMLNRALHDQPLTSGTIETMVVTGNLLLAKIEELLETRDQWET